MTRGGGHEHHELQGPGDLTRHRARTLLAACTLSFAIACLGFLAVPNLLNAAMNRQIAGSRLYDVGISTTTLDLSPAQLRALGSLPGVAAISPAVGYATTVTSAAGTQDVELTGTALGTAPINTVALFTGRMLGRGEVAAARPGVTRAQPVETSSVQYNGQAYVAWGLGAHPPNSYRLSAGHWFTTADARTAIPPIELGPALARAARTSLGQILTLSVAAGPTRVRVIGIDTVPTNNGHTVYFPLPVLERCLDTARHIRRVFSAEAMILAIAGWVFGVLFGWLIYQGLAPLLHNAALSLPQEFPPVIPLVALAGVLALTLIVIRGPLRRATRIQPGTALRYQ